MVSTQNIFDAISEEDTSFWLETCKLLDWETFPESCFRGSFSNPSWFSDGRLNVCYNCVDRHYRNNPNKTALIWAQNDGLYEYISYEKLFSMVNAYAFFLKEKGIQKGDVVAIHNTMTPHSVYAMLACARIGAIHTVIFAGFSGDYVKERVRDSHAKMLLSGYIGFRGDKKIVLHEKVRDITVPVYFFPDKRVSFDGVSTVIDIDLYASQIVEPVSVFSNDPLFVLYTSGSTGKPKGLVHGSGGYLTYVSYTTKVLFQDFVVSTHCCVADLGWITGHSYVVYGPLALGMTSVLFESTPYYPDANRYWKLIEDCKAESFYTAPTALRSVIEKNKKSVPCLEFDLSSLKVLGSVGEPIDEKTWTWYFEHVGAKRCSIQDTWWQTETGGILIAPGKQFDDTKAGWALCPMKGIAPTVVDVSDGVGKLFIEKSWPGQALTILNNHALYETLYFNTKHGFFTGDLAVFDQNNTYFKILGRFDDVINVSGHRFGVAELEDAVMKSGNVSEIAVIAVDDSVSGSALVAVYVAEGIVDVQKILRNAIGPVARIATAIRVRALPKTRSGKVMRRVLRDVYEGKDVTNIQGIEDDSLLLQLQEAFCRTS